MDKDLELLLKVPEIRDSIINHARTLHDQDKVQYLTMILAANPKNNKVAYDLAATYVKLEDYIHAEEISTKHLNETDRKIIATKICIDKAQTLWIERRYNDALGELLNLPGKDDINIIAKILVRKYLPKADVTAYELKQLVEKYELEKQPPENWEHAFELSLRENLEKNIEKLNDIRNLCPALYKKLLTEVAETRTEKFLARGEPGAAIESLTGLESISMELYEKNLTRLLNKVDDKFKVIIYDLLIGKGSINEAENSFAKAQLLENMEKFDEAIQAYKDFEKYGGCLDTRLNVADLLFKKGDFEKALEIYTDVISHPYQYGLTSMENAKNMKTLTLKALGRPEEELKKEETKQESAKKGFFGKKKR